MAKKPTLKQKAVALDILGNVGKPIGQAMRDAGYSKGMADNPQVLTESVGWAMLMEKYLPDDKVLQVHREGLEATKVVSAVIMGKDANSKTNDFIDVPDHPTRMKAVELAYKVKKRLGGDVLIQNNIIQDKKEKYGF